LKTYRDLKGVIDTAFDEGKLEGILLVAKKLKDKGVELSLIIETTGLANDEIERL
jgi:hypothetical protein